MKKKQQQSFVLFCINSDTTRAMRPGEVPGREYLFVTRDKMETDISAGKYQISFKWQYGNKKAKIFVELILPTQIFL